MWVYMFMHMWMVGFGGGRRVDWVHNVYQPSSARKNRVPSSENLHKGT